MDKKTWIIIASIVVLVVAVVCLLIGRFMPRQITEADLANYAEPDKYALTGKVAVSPSVPAEDAKLLEVAYDWDKDPAAAGALIIRSVTIKNKSDRTIDRAYVSLRIFDGKNGTGNELLKRSPFIGDVGPGKIGSTGLGGAILLDNLKNPRSFVITLESVAWKGNVAPSATTPVPTPTSTVTKETPSQVVKNFFTAMAEGRYQDAQKYSNNPTWFTYIRGEYEKNPQKRVVRLTVLKEEIYKEHDSATVACIFYFADGTSETGDADLELVNGEWKL